MIQHVVTMIARQELFCLPPLGHVGVILFKYRPGGYNIGDTIEFVNPNDPEHPRIGLGQVTAIEAPKSNIRPDIEKNGWKIHWVPVDKDDFDRAIKAISGHLCSRCGNRSGVFMTKVVGEALIRTRRCKKCRLRWTTKEIFQAVLESKERRRRTKGKK